MSRLSRQRLRVRALDRLVDALSTSLSAAWVDAGARSSEAPADDLTDLADLAALRRLAAEARRSLVGMERHEELVASGWSPSVPTRTEGYAWCDGEGDVVPDTLEHLTRCTDRHRPLYAWLPKDDR